MFDADDDSLPTTGGAVGKMRNRNALETAGREIKANPPAILNKTRIKSGAKMANKQRVAILLSKARSAGAKIPQRKRG